MRATPTHRLCVHWPRLGPYHLARLTGAHEHALKRDAELVALETAGNDRTYEWKKESAQTDYTREVIFPNRIYEEIDAAEMHLGVTATLDRLQPDAVAITSYSTPDARAGLLWCKRHRRSAILMTATKEDDVERVGWRETVKSKLINLFDAALVAGTPQREYLEKLGFPKELIFQGCDSVDNDYFAREAAHVKSNPSHYRILPGLDSESPYFLASNRFVPRKNLNRFLEAYRVYRACTVDPWRLLMLGDGPERESLETQVKQQNIEGVEFCGFRQIEELPAYYALAGAFVHPSLVEQWGLVVNEAMAAGLPVLVSNRAGCAKDLVKHGRNGYTFDPTNIDELAHWLGVLSDPQTDRKRMGQASVEIIANWSPERFGSQMWAAVDAAQERAKRNVLTGRAGLWLIQKLSRRVNSFHSFQD